MPSERDTERFTEIVSQLKNLRNDVERAGMRLFRAAHEVETKERSLWNQFYPTFDAFLEENNVCDSRRYRDFVAAEPIVGGASAADEMGSVGPVIEAAKIQDTKRRAKYIEAATKRFETKGVGWSDQESTNQRKNIAGTPPTDSNWNKKVDREADLHAENVELKKKILRLEALLREKDDEIRKLKNPKRPKAEVRADAD
jgi:hypothetical protein